MSNYFCDTLQRPEISIEELAKNVASYCKKEGKIATLALDCCWWSKRVYGPHDGYICPEAIGFPMSFSKKSKELKEALRNEGCIFKSYDEAAAFGLVAANEEAISGDLDEIARKYNAINQKELALALRYTC